MTGLFLPFDPYLLILPVIFIIPGLILFFPFINSFFEHILLEVKVRFGDVVRVIKV